MQTALCSVRLSKRTTLRLPPVNTADGAKYYQVSRRPHSFTPDERVFIHTHDTMYTYSHQRFYMGLLGGGAMGAQPPSSSQKPNTGFINAVFADHDSGSNSGGRRRNLLLSDWAMAGGGVAFPSLLLLEEARLAPVEHAVGGRNYTMAVSGFNFAVAGVEIRLFEGVPPTVREEATVTLPKITTGEEGGRVVSVTLMAPEPTHGRGRSRAYLRASYLGLPMPFADSLAFDLVSSSSNGAAAARGGNVEIW